MDGVRSFYTNFMLAVFFAIHVCYAVLPVNLRAIECLGLTSWLLSHLRSGAN